MGPKTGSAASTIISVRPLSSTSFSVPTLVGAQAIEGISCAQMHFLVVQAIENIGQQAGLEKVKTLSIRPPLLLTNALPIGRLGLQFASATVTVPALQRLCFYGTSLAELRRGLNLCAQLAEGPWSGKEFLAGDDVVDTTGNVQGDEAKVLELRISSKGAAAALNLECLGHGELRLSCPHWLLDRSGLKETSYGRLEVHTRGAPLPSLEGVTLLPSDCFETPCDFVIRGPNGSVAAKYSMKMPPNFEAFVWRVPNGCLALNLQTGTVLNSSVFGATCMEFTLMPRLLLTNASDEDLQIETSQRSQLRLAPGESRVMHWEVPENTDGIDVLATTFRFRPSYANAFSGAVLCSDASAGSTPFSLTTAPGVVEVWSVDVSPLHGNLGVSIRKGSDFAAVNRTEDVRMQVQPISRFIHGCVIAISSGTGEKVIEVAPGERLPIGWATPFAGNRCREAKVTVGSEELSIDLQRTGTWPLKALGHRHGWIREETTGLALRVSRHGTTTELSLEDSAEKGAGSPRSGAQVSDEISASLALRVKLGRAGISLIDENPPRELFFFSLDMLRLEYLQDAVRDSEKVTLSVSEVQAICQLPDRTDGQDKVNMLDPSRLQHLPDALFKNQEFPAVVLANHSAGGKSFLQFQMMREATSSRDLLISSARLDVDKLDFTLDERWLTPLQTWLMHISGQGGFDLFGAPASELLAKAGKPITDGYVAPPVPAVVQAQGVKISALDTTVWCSLRLKYLEFLPAYIRAAVKVFSASNYFTLDGVSLALPARELEPHRGSLQD
ncbi:Vacuolar protein sorting-associated protein 13A, partial [Durusdinium trenchii]